MEPTLLLVVRPFAFSSSQPDNLCAGEVSSLCLSVARALALTHLLYSFITFLIIFRFKLNQVCRLPFGVSIYEYIQYIYMYTYWHMYVCVYLSIYAKIFRFGRYL